MQEVGTWTADRRDETSLVAQAIQTMEGGVVQSAWRIDSSVVRLYETAFRCSETATGAWPTWRTAGGVIRATTEESY